MFTRTDDKTTTIQTSILVSDSVLGAGILTLPRAVTVAAQTPDTWLSLLLGGLIVLLPVTIMAKLSQQFPGNTIFQFAGKIIGKFPAIFICLVLIVYFVLIAGFEIRVLSEVTLFFLLEGTPIWAVLIPFIWLSCYLLFGGINSIARLFQIIFPISLFVLIISFVLSARLFELDNLRPVLGNGLQPVLQGLKSTVLVFAGYEIIMVVVAHMQHPKKAIKAAIGGIGIPVVLYFFTIVMVVGGMSIDAVVRSTWPTIDLLRSFEVAGVFFERLEFPFLVIWTLQLFCNFTTSYYGASIGISHLFKLRFHLIIFVLMPLIYLVAMLPDRINDVFQLGNFIGWFSVGLFLLIPLPLSIILLIRRKGLKQDV